MRKETGEIAMGGNDLSPRPPFGSGVLQSSIDRNKLGDDGFGTVRLVGGEHPCAGRQPDWSHRRHLSHPPTWHRRGEGGSGRYRLSKGEDWDRDPPRWLLLAARQRLLALLVHQSVQRPVSRRGGAGGSPGRPLDWSHRRRTMARCRCPVGSATAAWSRSPPQLWTGETESAMRERSRKRQRIRDKVGFFCFAPFLFR